MGEVRDLLNCQECGKSGQNVLFASEREDWDGVRRCWRCMRAYELAGLEAGVSGANVWNTARRASAGMAVGSWRIRNVGRGVWVKTGRGRESGGWQLLGRHVVNENLAPGEPLLGRGDRVFGASAAWANAGCDVGKLTVVRGAVG